jgi:hypothetical protein
MASFKTLARAKLYQVAVKQILGVTPEISASKDNVKLYLTPAQQKEAAKNYKELMTKKSDIDIDISSAIVPYYVEKYGLYATIGVLTAFLLGRYV